MLTVVLSSGRPPEVADVIAANAASICGCVSKHQILAFAKHVSAIWQWTAKTMHKLLC